MAEFNHTRDLVATVVTVILIVVAVFGIWAIADPPAFSDTMRQVLMWLLVVGIMYMIYKIGMAIEAYMRARAERRVVERQAEFQHFGEREQVWRVVGDEVEAMHLDPRWRHDGVYTEPTQTELYAYTARMASFASGGKSAQIDYPVESGEARLPLLMDEIAGQERLAIYGASGSGKTNLLQHIINSEPGRIIVIDIHGIEWPWPDFAEPYGVGQNYEEIDGIMDWIDGEIVRRYELGSGRAGVKPDHSDPVGDTNFPATTIMIDEWTEYVDNAPDEKVAVRRVQRLLTAGRKIHMFVVLAAHIDTAAGTGFKGRMALLKSVPTIQLEKNAATGVYSATFRPSMNSEPYVVQTPGPFRGYRNQLAAPQEPITLPGPRLGADETKVLALWDAGLRKPSPIAREALGHDGGNQIEQVRDIIEKHRGMRP